MGNRTRVKMCGTTTVGDAKEAVLAGVDAIGCIFAEKSPRRVSIARAREIAVSLPPFVDLVGVFVDQDIEEIGEIIREVGLSHVQLHGGEDPELCRQIGEAVAPCRVIKAFRIGAHSRADAFRDYTPVSCGFLLDTYEKGQQGGTGKIFDWSLIGLLQLGRPVILAGGLGPGNVAEAIRTVRPFAVDVNSGVEVAPGIKDCIKLRALMDQVKLADSMTCAG
ncbi:MAG: phosphoribosylanthranilate isomerase [Desulfocapsaceae bacterium]|nr:phosphoribosylanthranilate isomerase [Desulfocapsaceae bacterium]